MVRISALWRPNTSSMASDISPTVARARAASMQRASRLPSPRAPSVRAVSAARRGALVAVGPDPGQALDLLAAHLGVVDVEHVDLVGVLGHVLVDPDDDLLAPVDPGLAAGRALLDAQLGHAGGDGLGHAAQLLDLLDEGPGLVGQVVGQLLDVVAAAERVDDVRHAGLLGQDQLGVAGDPGARSRWAGRGPRRRRWCAGSGCRPAPRPGPRRRCARRCCTGPAR